MELTEILIIKSDERGVIYDCGACSFISRKEGSVSANHTHEDSETIFLVKWKVELIIGDETQIVSAPIMWKISSNIYHKVITITDIELIIDRDHK